MKIMHWVGVDDHADKWTIAAFTNNGDRAEHEFELVPNASGYRTLIGFLKGLRGEVHVVYEAGPCGYELYRRLNAAKIRCEVAAPSLTPVKPGDRVKTNRRDARKLACALRSGTLTMIVVPDAKRESIRDVVRGREAVLHATTSLRHQITHLLLRHGERYREGKAWTQRFWGWLTRIRLSEEASQFVLDELLRGLRTSVEQLKRFDDQIEALAQQPEYSRYITALRVVRGIDTLTAMVLLSELGDLRRFATAPQLMAAIGVVPSERSTGDKTVRLSITKTGNAHVRRVLVEAAWQYQRRITSGPRIRRRRIGQPAPLVAIAEKCDLRLNRKFHRMTGRGKPSTVAAVAVARELAGFIWGIGQIEHP
jgi:transposase